MSGSNKITNKPKETLITPKEAAIGVAVLLSILWLVGNLFGFIVVLVVAALIGQLSNYLLPTKIPYGWLGATGAGLVGAWLGSRILGTWGPSLADIQIVQGTLGAMVVSVGLQYKRKVDRAKTLETLKAKSDSSDPYLLTELDGYILTEALGKGSNSKVYLGLPEGTLDRSQSVACKILNEEAGSSKELLSRYGREIRIAHKLDHPGIVRMYSWGEQEQLLFLIMEYVPGGTLCEKVIEGGLPVAEAREYIGQIMAALHHAHSQDIVHRDIKPANIFFTKGRCKIGDFGLGRAIADDVSLTKEGTVLGTPAYIAPEQIQGQKPTSACDQYATGVLFYELLTGERPFTSNDSLALLMQQLQQTPPSPKDLRPDLDDRLVAIVLRMLEKDPEARFPSMQDCLNALKELD